MRSLVADDRGIGTYSETWYGRDARGDRVPPGIYVVLVSVETDEGESQRVTPVAVVY